MTFPRAERADVASAAKNGIDLGQWVKSRSPGKVSAGRSGEKVAPLNALREERSGGLQRVSAESRLCGIIPAVHRLFRKEHGHLPKG
jgi:hypothetical protein